jgi:hypothetical protein
MAKLTAEQIANVALSAGVPRDQVATAVAIALAESGGNTHAHNKLPPDNSYGLWQINMLGELGSARRKKFGLANNEELFTPSVNARAMMAISGGGKNWTPWTTYTRGLYLTRMAEANRAASKATGQTSTVSIPGSDTFEGLTKGIATLVNPQTWIRVGLLVSGFILLLLGIAKLTGDNQLSPLTKQAVKAVVFRKVSK